MNSRKISSYVPLYYSGIVEFNTVISIEDDLFDVAEGKKTEVQANQFILTADVEGIKKYEGMLGIIANPSIESLEFRRERLLNRWALVPPFTFQFLKNKLNAIIGEGKWNAYVDFPNYTLYIESSATNQSWFNEISITVNGIKPANIIFINQPLLSHFLEMSEQISYQDLQYNYVLGISWVLGQKPFTDYIDKGVIKLAETASLSSEIFQDVATFTAGDIASVLINDLVSITSFITKSAALGVATIEYVVPSASVSQITSIKLLDAESNVLSSSVVYVPVVGNVQLKHTITVREG